MFYLKFDLFQNNDCASFNSVRWLFRFGQGWLRLASWAVRSILSVRSYPDGCGFNAQVVRRASVSRITKSFKLLSDEQLEG